MKELLKLLTVALVVSAVYAEEAKADAEVTEHKDAAMHDTKTEEKMETKHETAAHVEHVNRKMANELTMRLSKMQTPYAGPMVEIPAAPCCSEGKTHKKGARKTVAHAHKTATHHDHASKDVVHHEKEAAEHAKDATTEKVEAAKTAA